MARSIDHTGLKTAELLLNDVLEPGRPQFVETSAIIRNSQNKKT
jgi:hypothetical protein